MDPADTRAHSGPWNLQTRSRRYPSRPTRSDSIPVARLPHIPPSVQVSAPETRQVQPSDTARIVHWHRCPQYRSLQTSPLCGTRYTTLSTSCTQSRSMMGHLRSCTWLGMSRNQLPHCHHCCTQLSCCWRDNTQSLVCELQSSLAMCWAPQWVLVRWHVLTGPARAPHSSAGSLAWRWSCLQHRKRGATM